MQSGILSLLVIFALLTLRHVCPAYLGPGWRRRQGFVLPFDIAGDHGRNRPAKQDIRRSPAMQRVRNDMWNEHRWSDSSHVGSVTYGMPVPTEFLIVVCGPVYRSLHPSLSESVQNGQTRYGDCARGGQYMSL